ncbi:MAG: hypothetical protein ACRC1Y_02580 [Paraclostridium sp.]
MVFKKLIDTTDYKTLYNKAMKDIDSFKYRNESLSRKIKNLEENLENSNNLLEIREDQIESLEVTVSQLEKKIKDIEDYSYKLEFEVSSVRDELSEYSPNLKPPKKKVDEVMIKNVRDMVINKGITYRVTSKKTGISIKTISRIINGYYDNK